MKKRLLAAAATAALVVAATPLVLAEERPDAGKRIAELPAEDLLRDTREDEGRRADENPRVAPGIIRWHDDLRAARAARAQCGAAAKEVRGKTDHVHETRAHPPRG